MVATTETGNQAISKAISREEAEAFVVHESRLLDERRFDEWMNLFTDEGYYWVPATADQTDPHTELSLIYDDREIMKQRLQRLKHPRAYAQLPPSRAVRQVSNLTIEEADETLGECTVRSVFFMFEFRPTLPEPTQRLFAGSLQHRLQRAEDGLKLVSKKVMLVNCDATFSPIFLYF